MQIAYYGAWQSKYASSGLSKAGRVGEEAVNFPAWARPLRSYALMRQTWSGRLWLGPRGDATGGDEREPLPNGHGAGASRPAVWSSVSSCSG